MPGGVQGAGCGVRGAGCRVRGAGCGVRGAGCGVRGAGCGVRGAGCGVRTGGCGLGGAEKTKENSLIQTKIQFKKRGYYNRAIEYSTVTQTNK